MNKILLSMTLGASLLFAHAAEAQPNRDRSLRAHLQTQFREARDSAHDSRYVVAWVDLNGDRVADMVFEVMGIRIDSSHFIL